MKRFLGFIAAAILLPACGGGSEGDAAPVPVLKPDFSLQDVNPHSATSTAMISPRSYLSQVSAWYFGHAT